MRVFPQLVTGAAVAYPLKRRRKRRTVVNTLAGGSQVKYIDADSQQSEWDVELTGLTDAEREAVEALFAEVRGRWGKFTFLEPAGNLLAQSENFAASEWNNGPSVTVTAGIEDPFGGAGARRVTNGGVAEEVGQLLAVPGKFQYTLSVWVRNATSDRVTLFARTDGGSVEREFAVGPAWKRVAMPVAIDVDAEGVVFGVRLSGSQTADLFGMQVEAQPGAGAYQKTLAGGGVHEGARFGSDVLAVRAQSSDVFDAGVRIISKGS